MVAQGVETAKQVQFLAGQNCDIVQGYSLSHRSVRKRLCMQFKKDSEENDNIIYSF